MSCFLSIVVPMASHQTMAPSDERSSGKQAAAFRDAIPDEVYPSLARLAEWSARHGYDEDADFNFGLTLVIDGFQRVLRPTRG